MTETSTTDRYDALAENIPRELYVYQLGVQEIFVRDCEHGVDCFKRAGTTSDQDEMVAHDGPVLIDGNFRDIERSEHGGVVSYHPYAGRMTRYDDLDSEATLLREVERIV